MNNKRRKSIAEIISKLNSFSEEVESILYDIEIVKDEEEECLENFPENLQGTERYNKVEESADNLNTAYDVCQDVVDNIEEIISTLEEASN